MYALFALFRNHPCPCYSSPAINQIRQRQLAQVASKPKVQHLLRRDCASSAAPTLESRILSIHKTDSPLIKTFVLQKPAGFSYSAGQSIDCFVAERSSPNTLHAASFSLVSAPTPQNEQILEVAVKATNYYPIRWLLNEATVGDTLRISAAARGQQFGTLLDASSSPLILIAAGIGVTPILSIAQHLQAHPKTRSVCVIHQAKTPAEFILWRRLVKFSELDPNARLLYFASEKHHQPNFDALDDSLRQKVTFGELDDDAVRSLAVSPDTQVIMCGPVGFMTSVSERILRLHSLPKGSIRTC